MEITVTLSLGIEPKLQSPTGRAPPLLPLPPLPRPMLPRGVHSELPSKLLATAKAVYAVASWTLRHASASARKLPLPKPNTPATARGRPPPAAPPPP